jgi:hypothetical protein
LTALTSIVIRAKVYSMLVAASVGAAGTAVVLIVVVWLLPLFFARRIARRKGRSWFGYWFFLGWIGVLVLALRRPKLSAGSLGSAYHVPPELARRQAAQRRR